MKPISSHAEKLSKVLSDPSLSDRRRYEGVLVEIMNLVPLSVLLIREHGQAVGASAFAWRVAALAGEADVALDQFEQVFEDVGGEDKELDRNELQSLSSSLTRFQMTEQQSHRLNVLLDRFATTYGEPV
ncbi:hypothetical protein [Phaeovulum vinaykumarii]|uniref:Uncharacterized protein n=1 Tax=Phaeovulum vinaykumarii TaxID=407234 RepID=A0A1N7N2F6_9RHOB|nr:hypothetical protein [Phaeovulum vinaykumarii]SIS92371.1 hypothetical protein SAMN05421795_1145 [Phaeovulum vinaykumarii]SOC18675.1 hypothetical protein SAMN05878426_11525 [Phaeovulum vinaykumarii]